MKATRRLALKLPRLPHRCSITKGSRCWGSFGPLQRNSQLTRETCGESVNLSIRVSKLMSLRHCLSGAVSALGGGDPHCLSALGGIRAANFQPVPGEGGDGGICTRTLPSIRIQVLAQTARKLQTKGLESKSRARMKAGRRMRLLPHRGMRMTTAATDRAAEPPLPPTTPQRKALGSRGLRSVLLPLPPRPRK